MICEEINNKYNPRVQVRDSRGQTRGEKGTLMILTAAAFYQSNSIEALILHGNDNCYRSC